MNPTVVAVVLILGGLLAVFLTRRGSPKASSPQREFASTDEMMAWLATEAVDIAKQNGVTGLDYSTDSIQRVEEALGKIHEEYLRTKSEEGVRGLASAFGAYIGECIRRKDAAVTWDRDHPAAGERSYPLHWQGGVAFPFAWCFKRIIEGPEDNVWHKYVFLSEKRHEMAKGPA